MCTHRELERPLDRAGESGRPRRLRGPRSAALWLALLASPAAAGADYTLTLGDTHGNPVENAVVMLSGAQVPAAAGPSPAAQPAIMDQRNREFDPHVLAVRTGAYVLFPNSDATRHHVYSFSRAKRFELKLYKGVPTDPIPFDQPGVVVLGCNIHDHMLGYIYVTDAPLFTTTRSDGRAVFENLAAGTYQVSIWHPRLDGENPRQEGEFTIGADTAHSESLTLNIRAPAATRKPDPLEHKFKLHPRE